MDPSRRWATPLLIVFVLWTGARFAAAQPLESEIWILNRGSGSVTIIGSSSGATPAIKSILAGLSGPQDCAWSPDGSYFFVTNSTAGLVSVCAPAGGAYPWDSFATGGTPYGISTYADGSGGLVSLGSDLPGAIAGTTFVRFRILAGGHFAVDPAVDTAAVANGGITGAVLDNVIAGATGRSYHSKVTDPYPGGAGHPAHPSSIQVLDAALAAPYTNFASPANPPGTRVGVPGNLVLNDGTRAGTAAVGPDADLRLDLHSGHLMAIDPDGRRVAMVVSSDANTPGAGADCDEAILNVHDAAAMATVYPFFGSNSAYAGAAQDAVAVNAHPNRNRMYVCVLDPSVVPAIGKLRVLNITPSGAPVLLPEGLGTSLEIGPGEVPTGVAFTLDGSRGYVICDRGAGAGSLRTFACDGSGNPVSGSLSAPLDLGNKPSALCTRPVLVSTAPPPAPPAPPAQSKGSKGCFVGALCGPGAPAGGPAAGAFVPALILLAAALAARRPGDRRRAA